MQQPKSCSRCGGTTLEPGELNGYRGAGTTFNLAKAPWFTISSLAVQVAALMCLDCGAIELTGDVLKAREVAKR